ncbi:MAG: hypothetical protein AAFR59_02760 [Bacteroidota bacterium]
MKYFDEPFGLQDLELKISNYFLGKRYFFSSLQAERKDRGVGIKTLEKVLEIRKSRCTFVAPKEEKQKQQVRKST